MIILGIAGTILKIMLIVILIGVMVMALMAINYSMLKRSNQLREENEKLLRKDVEQSERVISRYSVFHEFLARDLRTVRSHSMRRDRRHPNA